MLGESEGYYFVIDGQKYCHLENITF